MADKVAAALEQARSLCQALTELASRRDSLASIVPPDLAALLMEIRFQEMRQQLEDTLPALGKLHARFSRPTLNIGVVGRARQGKSRLLQSLSGLTDAEIPSGDREHCTGTRSVLYHHEQEATFADVYFYTERSFLDNVLRHYYSRLGLGPCPHTLDSFAAADLSEQNRPTARLGAMFDHLRRYRDKLPDYRQLLHTSSPARVPREKIREFVAQDTPDGRRVYSNYLAVEQVHIFCRFPHGDVGRVAFIDMPGLGDTGVGDEERLIETLGREVDFVLFVRKPSSDGDYWADFDHDLYDTAYNALAEMLPLERWSFMVLNHVRGSSSPPRKDNAPNCEDLARSMAANGRIRVTRCGTADCSDPAEVKGKVLDLILDYLVEHVAGLDAAFADSCQDGLRRVQEEIARQLQAARGLLHSRSFGPTNDQALFTRKFNAFWKELTSGLESLLRDLRRHRHHKDPGLVQAIKRAVQECRKAIPLPDVDTIRGRADEVGDLLAGYSSYLNQFRADVACHFLCLDDTLSQWVEGVKNRVAEALKRTALGKLSPAEGEGFLQVIRKLFTADCEQLERGFGNLCDFKLSYRLLIQHRIRKHLDLLDADEPDGKAPPLTPPPSAEQVRFHLDNQFGEVLYLIEPELEKFVEEPSEAAFAVVEEFVDRVLRAGGAQDEWRLLANELRSQLWKEDFHALGEQTRTRREWEETVQRALGLCRPLAERIGS